MSTQPEGWRDTRLSLIRELGRILVKTEALRFGTFTLTSGKLSSYYIDFRIVPSFPGAFRKAVDAYVELIKNELTLSQIDLIGGIPTAGLPYAAVVSYVLGKPMVYARPEKKGHGLERMIEGVISPGQRVLMLDDLITSGGSIAQAIELVRREGGVVESAVVLIDRVEGGRERLQALGVRLHALTTILEVAELLYAMNVIDEAQVKAIQEQMQGGA